jgi:CrcB protein
MRAMRDEKRAVLKVYVAVGFGAAVGSLLRFLSGVLIVSVMGLSALWATGFVNVLGSFVIGLFAALTGPDGRLLVSPAGRQFVTGGICGGFTTFSAMSLDTFILLLQGDIPLAGLYLVLVVALSLVAVWVGHMVAARLNE